MRPKKNALEWTVFGVSLLIIALTAWLLMRDSFSPEERTADLRVIARQPVRVMSGYMVPVVVTNDGHATAEGVRVEVALMKDGVAVESAEVAIAFVPRQSRREAVVVFRNDPACCRIETRALSYEKP